MLKELESVEECVYFTRREIDNGFVKVWVFKEMCPKCGKVLMSKPRDEKTGKVKIRAKEYECSECKFRINKEGYEETLTASIKYRCPYCQFEGEIRVPFKRKKIKIFDEEGAKKKTVETLRFQCEKCKKDIDVTKKMK